MELNAVKVRIAPTLYPSEPDASRRTALTVFNNAYDHFVQTYEQVIIPALRRNDTVVVCRGYAADFFARYSVITGTIPFGVTGERFFNRYPLLRTAYPPDLTFWFDVHRKLHREWRARVSDPREFEHNEKNFLIAKIAIDEFLNEVRPSKTARLYEEEFQTKEAIDVAIKVFAEELLGT
jgi:thymidylate kinase